ncbi:MAG: GTPase domain-containing protein [Candidatus Thorarchaeota archaeon]
MIERIYIIAQGGILCYSKNYICPSEVEDDLISGFLTAISGFAKAVKVGEIKSLNFKNFNFIYSYSSEFDCMFIIVVDIEDLEDEAREKLELMKIEFINRYQKYLKDWTGKTTVFETFDEFVEEHIFISPKVLLVGETGVGKTTIMDLFPGETILDIGDDMTEIIEKTVDITNLGNIKQFILREIDIEDLINSSKYYKPLLNACDIICILTNSAASNLRRTEKLFSKLKKKVRKADFYIIANFQDLKETSFEPKEIEQTFGVKTYGFSAIQEDSAKNIFLIMNEILKVSIYDRIQMKQKQVSEKVNSN